MYLIKLLPEQVMQHWSSVRTCIITAVPSHILTNEDSLLYIQQQLLLGMFECWIGTDTPSVDTVYGVLTTTIIYDPISRSKNLLIYSVTMTDEYPRELWQLTLSKMQQYAKAKECNKIIAYSDNRYILGLAETLGANTSQHLIVFDLD